jgi:hypothetical protein
VCEERRKSSGGGPAASGVDGDSERREKEKGREKRVAPQSASQARLRIILGETCDFVGAV